ncbi:MAG: hypothetical protein HKN24_10065 [Acidimicrobiales bacterium]|nr:hypothetical protein [Acidimicrobiales bacterium]
MPIAPNRKNPANQAAVIAIAGVLGAVAIAFLLTRIASQASEGEIQLNIGDDKFFVGDAEDLAQKIDDEDVFGGDPLLISGLGNDRDVYVQHIGEDPLAGWLVFAVRPDDATRDCFVVWDRDRSEFVGNDVCPDLVYSEDGRGLRQYPVEIIDGQVVATIAG